MTGSDDPTIYDLHRRLADVGHPVDYHEVAAGSFGPDTTRALLAFQGERGLDEHGTVDDATHAALVEAGHRLGDRHLYLHAPMFRGDDVADLQLRLGSLGFDAGRIDGILGPDTASAVSDFQRNIGLAADGIAGPLTVHGLRRLLGRTAGRQPVAQVRELDRLRRSRPDLVDQRIAIGEFGGTAALAGALTRLLRARGAHVLELDQPDEARQAGTANEFDAGIYLGLRLENHSQCRTDYFATDGFRSEGGLRLAHHCADALDRALRIHLETATDETVKTTCTGRRLPILRQTRMPAVLCTLAPASTIVLATAEIADCLASAVTNWLADPTADPV